MVCPRPASSECHRAIIADQLHCVAAYAAAVFVDLVILDGNDFDATLFQKPFGLLRRAVHDDPTRFDGNGVGRIKLDLVARAFDQFVADRIEFRIVS